MINNEEDTPIVKSIALSNGVEVPMVASGCAYGKFMIL